jgi:hypothetical protein
VQVSGDRLTLTAAPSGRARIAGRRFATGTWRSPWRSAGFTELVASWQAATPRGSWVAIEVRGRNAQGAVSSWDTLARWTSGEGTVRRTTFGTQADDLARVAVDTWRTAGLVAFQLRLTLARPRGTRAAVSVGQLTAVTSQAAAPIATSTPTAVGTVLDVPQYSQMVHAGHYPAWGGGGEAWCSPTSLAMVLAYFGARPSAAWVPAGHPDPWVDEVARRVYDGGYRGTGTWPFNTAYAGSLGLDAFVTRLRDLTDVERFVAAGIPVVVSVRFARGQLTGAPIGASNGHLLVVVGFDAAGNPVVNDPAAPSDATVRRTYDRGQLERAWLGGSSGTAYVVHDAAQPLPPGPGPW